MSTAPAPDSEPTEHQLVGEPHSELDVRVFQHGLCLEPRFESLETARDFAAERSDAIVLVMSDCPSERAITQLAENLQWPQLLRDDVLHPHQRPKIERYEHAVYAVVKSATYRDHTENIDFSEFYIVVTGNVVVCFRAGGATDTSWYRHLLDQPAQVLALGPEAFVYAIIDQLVDDYFPVIDGITEDIQQIERQVFSGDRTAPQRIYALSREIIDFHSVAVPLASVLDRLNRGLNKYNVVAELRSYLADVADHLGRVTERIETMRSQLDRILAVNATLVSQEQNEAMKKISSWAAILFAPTLIAAMYGMNFRVMPELELELGYPMALSAMVLLSSGLWFAFRKKNWL